ncbi:TIGR00725 family protein [Rhizobium sp. BR 315]|uniref:TIGR00725 family protein n=1 Tax=Rhizobium sp. BR 315 TaxID=3040014 RepID=UPI003D3566A6
MMKLQWIERDGQLICGERIFDPSGLEWISGAISNHNAENVTPSQALQRLAVRQSLKRVPIGIIGPREATPAQYDLAEQLGAALADHGLQLLCGGKTGVMEAACKGHASKGGLPIGILPDEEWQAANPYVAIPIASGIGPARNAIIARACLALIAIGGGVGTLSEMALGLQFNRVVLAMADAPPVIGASVIATVDEALERIAAHLFKIM